MSSRSIKPRKLPSRPLRSSPKIERSSAGPLKLVERRKLRAFSKSRVNIVSPACSVMNEAPWLRRNLVSSDACGVSQVATLGRYVQLKSRVRPVSQPRSTPKRLLRRTSISERAAAPSTSAAVGTRSRVCERLTLPVNASIGSRLTPALVRMRSSKVRIGAVPASSGS